MRKSGRFSRLSDLRTHSAWTLVLSPFAASRRLAMVLCGLGAGLLVTGMQVGAQQAYPYPSSPYGSGYGQYQQAPPVVPYGYVQPPANEPPQYPQPDDAPPENQSPQSAEPQPYGEPAQPGFEPTQPYEQPGEGEAQQSYPTQQPLSAESLEQLVAPIALYPDALLAQILAASTYPAQVAVADQWLHQMQAQGYGSPDQVATGANAQNWDASVKALTAFPQVLDMMNQNLEWTTNLGEAYYNQPSDVMQTVQVLRQRAQEAGNLQPTPQESVTEDQGSIALAPANPETVYVPVYNPWYAYGAPLAPYPGFSFAGAWGAFWGSMPIRFGLGIALGAFEHWPWGWLGWGLNWAAHAVLFNHGAYFTHSASVRDWGFPRGGPRAYGGWARSERYGAGGYRGAQAYGGSNFRGPRESLGRPAESWGRSAQAFSRQAQPYSGYGRSEGFNRGLANPETGYAQPNSPQQQAFNREPRNAFGAQSYGYRSQAYGGRAQAYPGNGSGFASRPTERYEVRPGGAFGSPYRSYSAPNYGNQRAFAAPPSREFAGGERSGGFPSFGRGREPKGFGGGRAPRGFSGGGRASRGFGHAKAPKMGHSGGHGGSGRRR